MARNTIADFEEGNGIRRKLILTHPDPPVRIGFVEHRGYPAPAFNERAPGPDHVSFHINADQVEGFIAAFDTHGLTHPAVVGQPDSVGSRLPRPRHHPARALRRVAQPGNSESPTRVRRHVRSRYPRLSSGEMSLIRGWRDAHSHGRP